MPPRRRRRSHSNWWTETHGGAPGWLIVAVAAAVIAFAAFAVFVRFSAPAPEAQTQIEPVLTIDTGRTPEATAPATPVVLFIGDSYTAGSGSTDPSLKWTTLASTQQGWDERNRGIPGTGYTTAAEPGSCGQPDCPAYPEQIATLAAATPNIVVISGGRNDGEADATFEAAATATINSAATTWPDAEIVVTSPIFDSRTTPESIVEKGTILANVAASVGATYLDIGHPLEGMPEYISGDGVHPNDAGHAAIAEAFNAAWSAR